MCLAVRIYFEFIENGNTVSTWPISEKPSRINRSAETGTAATCKLPNAPTFQLAASPFLPWKYTFFTLFVFGTVSYSLFCIKLKPGLNPQQ
jgi:hypothetical protein